MEIIYWMVWAIAVMGPTPNMNALEAECLEKHPKARIELQFVPVTVRGEPMMAELVICMERKKSEPKI